jgi:hypothetical protein
MAPVSPSHRQSRTISLALWLVLACAAPVHAQHQPVTRTVAPNLPGPVAGHTALVCGPGDNSAACVARRVTARRDRRDAAGLLPPPTRFDDIPGTRFVPPDILAFLYNNRIDPQTRAFLRHVAGKPTEDWTLTELQLTTQIVPVLAETAVPTRVLSNFYEFLGLDPTSLFEPQLGRIQQTTSAFDARNPEATEQAQCFYLLGYGENLDPTKVTIKDVSACTGGS